MMTPQQVEEKFIELIHREPFIPFIAEMKDGTSIEIPHPRLAIAGGGAGFISPTNGAIVDVDFSAVCSIRVGSIEAVA